MQSLLDQLSELKGMMHSLESERDAIQAAETAAPVPTPVPAKRRPRQRACNTLAQDKAGADTRASSKNCWHSQRRRP